jgi:hypothetical protein
MRSICCLLLAFAFAAHAADTATKRYFTDNPRLVDKSAAFLMFLDSISNLDRPGGVAYPYGKRMLTSASPSKRPQGTWLVRCPAKR